MTLSRECEIDDLAFLPALKEEFENNGFCKLSQFSQLSFAVEMDVKYIRSVYDRLFEHDKHITYDLTSPLRQELGIVHGAKVPQISSPSKRVPDLKSTYLCNICMS